PTPIRAKASFGAPCVTSVNSSAVAPTPHYSNSQFDLKHYRGGVDLFSHPKIKAKESLTQRRKAQRRAAYALRLCVVA
ncbi:MAG: hypothetical protein WCI11_20075, partial [Candidatus Methylumidiphilus sp.]